METIKTVNFMLCNLTIICTHAIYKETNNMKHTQIILSPQTTRLQVYRKNPICHKKTSTQKRIIICLFMSDGMANEVPYD